MEVSKVPCTLCRKRRVKCDKRLPGCARCEKSSRSCPGYNHLRRFLDEGQNLRKKFSAAGAGPQGSGPIRSVKTRPAAQASSSASSISGSLDSALLPTTVSSGSAEFAQTQTETPIHARARAKSQAQAQGDVLQSSSLGKPEHDSLFRP
ncbi:hypothetical protein Trco_000463 [Trichoderma cornu-damae]|uniref:Zn(2)-C6 fungal-type domain-containing protein n=1 Tax=Trichoderma cornu-damae TaxID=654480 RepID=A0A9P8QW62_9HYPO|nr:hypothetical protein Trco_000463 [Trichoderma cornu-damae]